MFVIQTTTKAVKVPRIGSVEINTKSHWTFFFRCGCLFSDRASCIRLTFFVEQCFLSKAFFWTIILLFNLEAMALVPIWEQRTCLRLVYEKWTRKQYHNNCMNQNTYLSKHQEFSHVWDVRWSHYKAQHHHRKSRITHPFNCYPMTTSQFIGGFPMNTDSKRQIIIRQSTSTDTSSIYKHLLKCWPWFLSLV